MTSLVTVFDGSGFLGRHTVKAFAEAGWRVRVACRHPNSANYLLPMGTVGQIQILKTDVKDADQIAAALKGAGAAVNLVGILYPAGGQGFEAVHAVAPATIAKAAKTGGVTTLIHVSTPGIRPDSESRYARSKALGELALRAEFPSATIMRPSLLFGPEDDFFNKFAWLARLSPVLPLIGGGHTKFQPVFAGDVADAIVRCASDPAAKGKIYELGGPGVYSFKEMLQLILRVTDRKRLLIPIPYWLAYFKAFFLQFLPGKLLTPDQVMFLKGENVVAPDALTFKDLGIVPDSLEAVLPAYLWRFRPKGQYQDFAVEKVSASPETR
jgi:uncharacterized protein YbjT (DUF2867 family)